MRPPLLVGLALAACSSATSPVDDAGGDATPDARVPHAWGERCGNAIDDDGDGLVDEDCVGLFAGAFAPG